ncbi:RNA polymerase sigma factor [Sphingobacterium suaedae]|uniref:RNA polymerase sigma factor n=1 Tax=Sphingobacterium suaedae TaxID=1686402 RepID=A0ABW5KET7_9SPHI
MNDTQLLELFLRVKQGDRNAFTTLYSSCWRVVYDLAFLKTRDEDEAKDILQEIFVNLWEKRTRLTIQSNVQAYLYRMAKHEIIRRLEASLSLSRKTDIYRAAVEELSHSLDASIEAKELKQRWDAEIAKLPQRQREIYTLHYERDYTIRDIALELGIAEQTVKNQLVAANKKIRQVMELGLLFYLITLPH